MNIQLTATGEQKIFHDHFKPFILVSNIDMPKMYNQGWNSYRFVGGEPDFTGNNIPCELKRETTNYLFYESQILIYRKDGTTVSGYYCKTINKGNNEVNETFNFD